MKPVPHATLDLNVPIFPIKYDQTYPVELLPPGTPSKFWLKLADSSPSQMEEQLKNFYSRLPPLQKPPAAGTYVVCLNNGTYSRARVIKVLSLYIFLRHESNE